MKGNSSKFLALLLSASMIMSPTASVLADTQEKAAQTESSAAAEEAPQSEETAETAEPETTPAETESSESTAETPAEEPTETPAAPAEDQTPAGSDETETPSADEDASEDTAEDTAKDGEETADTTEKEPEAADETSQDAEKETPAKEETKDAVKENTSPAAEQPKTEVKETTQNEASNTAEKKETKAAEAAQKQEETESAQKSAEAEKQKAAAGGSDWDTSGLNEDWGADAADMKAYSCPSCGAELICDASTAATFCPYCGNPTVVPGQFAGTLKPDFVIPFKLSREDAIRELKKHYRGKVFLPKSFSKENHLQEIQGVYVPFWLFSGEAEGNAHYECTRSHKRTEGEYEVIKTEHFDVYRAGTMPFEKVPVDASTKMPDDHMDSIEPYNYDDLKPFSTAYLPGFLADKFDVSADKSRERADVRCLGSLKKALQGTVTGYATCFPRGEHADIQRGKVHYALLPVWLLNTKWQGKDFLFAMNGQTGKLVGDLPVDKGRFWGMFAAIAVPLSVLSSVIVLLMR